MILKPQTTKSDHGSTTSHGNTYTSSTYNKVNQEKELQIYVHPDELKGVDTLWKIMSDCNNIAVTASCIVFIGSIYHNVSDSIIDKREEIEEDLVKKCIKQIDHFRNIVKEPIPEDAGEYKIKHIKLQKEFAAKQIERNFLHLKSFMENSEFHGLDDFLQFNSLNSSDNRKVSFLIFNKISWGQGSHSRPNNAKRYKFEAPLSMTLWTLKYYLATKLDVDPQLLKIEKLGLHSREFKASENWQTLKDLGFDNEDKYSITTKMANTLLDQLNLRFSDDVLTPEAEKMLEEVFAIYTNEDGQMSTKA